VNTKINRVPVEHFIKRESQDQAPPVKGLLTLASDLTATGNSQKALVDTLNGNASFTINNGVLLNANLEQQLCQAIATLNRKQLGSEPRGKDTPFEELRGSLVIRNGVASNPDLKVRIPGLTVNGHGDLDLRVLGMDYNVGIIVEGDQRAMPDPACQVNERFVGIEVPLRCRGPLELGAKACRLDQDGLGRSRQTGRQPPERQIDESSKKNSETKSARNSKMRSRGCSSDESRAVFQRGAGMVRPPRSSRPALATGHQPIPGVGLGNHAAADPGQHRAQLLRPFHAGAADRAGAG
jgi:uncharacterized protein involved in outer membrane biogenesis